MPSARWQPLDPKDEALLLRLAGTDDDVGEAALIAATHLPLRADAWGFLNSQVERRLAAPLEEDRRRTWIQIAQWMPAAVRDASPDGIEDDQPDLGRPIRRDPDEAWMRSPAPGYVDLDSAAAPAEDTLRLKKLADDINQLGWWETPADMLETSAAVNRALDAAIVTALFRYALNDEFYDVGLGNGLLARIASLSDFKPDLTGLFLIYREALFRYLKRTGKRKLRPWILDGRDGEDDMSWLSWHLAWTASRAGIVGAVSGMRSQLKSADYNTVIAALSFIADCADYAVQREPEFFGGDSQPERLGPQSAYRVFPGAEAALTMPATAPVTAIEKKRRREVDIVRVFYATNRAIGEHAIPRRAYRNRADPSNSVHHGEAIVEIPDRPKGTLGTFWLKRWMRLEFHSDRIVVTRVTPHANARQFYQRLRDYANTQTENSALVYIHGFNVSFRDCMVRAAQLSFDLNHKGVTAAFSWPSRAKALKYWSDRERIEASEAPLAEFLRGLATESGLERVHIIAHSMGNRGLARAFQRLESIVADTGITYGQIILAAPDIDVVLFRELAKIYPKLSERTTLYTSARDRALHLSKFLQDSDRAGFYPPITTVPGIDTIEVSNIDVTLVDLGHDVYAASKELLFDMGDLLRNGSPPDRRQFLRHIATDEGTYWRLRK